MDTSGSLLSRGRTAFLHITHTSFQKRKPAQQDTTANSGKVSAFQSHSAARSGRPLTFGERNEKVLRLSIVSRSSSSAAGMVPDFRVADMGDVVRLARRILGDGYGCRPHVFHSAISTVFRGRSPKSSPTPYWRIGDVRPLLFHDCALLCVRS